MTRSTFDPDGGETEHSGSTHLGPEAANISHMPPDVTDGAVEAAAEESVDPAAPPARDSEEAAGRLRDMTGDAAH